jgi:hypothetical protein
MRNKYYVLQKFDTSAELTEVKNIRDLFSDVVIETEMLGKSPLMYATFNEANKVSKGLDLLFKGRSNAESFVVVKEIDNE